jgi:hypothetical protein
MLAGEIEAFPFSWNATAPDLMGQRRKDEPPMADEGWAQWHLLHHADAMRFMTCDAAAYWVQMARDLKPEELATAAMATVVGGHPGAWERVTTAQLLGCGVEGWLRRLAGARDPDRLHWALADRVLKDEPETHAARVRDSLGRALCDALRELAKAVLPAFLVPDLELEKAAAGAAAAALAWLEPRALPGDTDHLAERFNAHLKAYRAAVGGPIAFADRVPLLRVSGGPARAPDGGWWVAPGGSNLHTRAVWREADRVPPVQPGKPADDERWGAPGGAELWMVWLPRCSEGKDSLIVRMLADAALARVRAEAANRRSPALMLGLVGSISRAAGQGAICEGGQIMAPLEPGGRKLIVVPMVAGATDWAADGNGAAVLALQLAAWLALEAHQQMDAGMADPDRVVLPVGRDAFSKATGGIRAERDQIEAALEWLRCVQVAGEGLIYGWDFTREPSPAGGRPAELLVVRVGEMLWPWRGLEWWNRHPTLEIPKKLKWLSPVLPVADAPLVGNHQTRGVQRAAWSVGLGAVLVERREEYADRGGVEWATLKAGLQRYGLWARTHNSLVERWMEEACRQPSLFDGAALERFEKAGKTLVRLGPDYADAEELVLGAAGRSKAARAAQAKGASKRRR